MKRINNLKTESNQHPANSAVQSTVISLDNDVDIWSMFVFGFCGVISHLAAVESHTKQAS